MSLDTTNNNVGYRLGRLFATWKKFRRKPALASTQPFGTDSMGLRRPRPWQPSRI